MPFWDRLLGRKPSELPRIVTKDEYGRIMMEIVRSGENWQRLHAVASEAIERFDNEIIQISLEEAKKVKGPITNIVEASAFFGRSIAYCGGADLRERFQRLINADKNLFYFSEFHRLAGDALYNQDKYDEAIDHYFTFLRYRPRYTYLKAKTELTPPELKRYAHSWPLIKNKDRHTHIRLSKRFATDASILAFLYLKLGRCLLQACQDYETANDAFNIAFWLQDKLGSKAPPSLVAQIHFGRGQYYFNQESYKKAIDDFEKAREMYKSIIPNETSLAESLIHLGEAYLKSKQTDSAQQILKEARETSRRLDNTELLKRAEELLSSI